MREWSVGGKNERTKPKRKEEKIEISRPWR
jgi:hypothetical protein